MRIARAAALTGLSPRQIRYYAERGVLPEPARPRGRHREFTDRDVRRLALLKTMLAADVPLTLVTRVLHERATDRERGEVESLLERHATAGRRARAALVAGSVDGPAGQPDISLMFDIYVLRTRMGAALTAALAEAGLTSSEYAVLSLLDDARTQSVPELARLLGGAPAALARQLAELARRGWVHRSADPGDRRRAVFVLTREGDRRFRAAIPLAARVAADLNRGLRDRGTEPETARHLLQTLSAALTMAPQPTR